MRTRCFAPPLENVLGSPTHDASHRGLKSVCPSGRKEVGRPGLARKERERNPGHQAPGEHTVKISKSGFKPWERKMKIAAGSIKVAAELEVAEMPKGQ